METLRKGALSWFGMGYCPWAPGTAGSLAALPFAWVFATWGGVWALVIGALGLTILGWAAAAATPEAADDPGWVVIDEVAGQWLTLAPVSPDPVLYVTGFLAFRFFDIAKPWPVGMVERRVPGALGVMADDLVAAIYAAAVTFAVGLLIGG